MTAGEVERITGERDQARTWMHAAMDVSDKLMVELLRVLDVDTIDPDDIQDAITEHIGERDSALALATAAHDRADAATELRDTALATIDRVRALAADHRNSVRTVREINQALGDDA